MSLLPSTPHTQRTWAPRESTWTCTLALTHTQITTHTHAHTQLPAPDTGFITTHTSHTFPVTSTSSHDLHAFIYICSLPHDPQSQNTPSTYKLTYMHTLTHTSTCRQPHTQMCLPPTQLMIKDNLIPPSTYKFIGTHTHKYTHICTHILIYRHHIQSYLLRHIIHDHK